MNRRAWPLALLALALTVLPAHADGDRRGGRAEGGERRGAERGQAYAPPPAAYAPAARGRAYAPPPAPYASPSRSRTYAAPAPYEPPLAPYYQTRPNSLGAQWAPQQDEARRGVAQGRIKSLSSVVQALSRLRPGRMLDAGLERSPDGRATYRVRWAATGGRRIDFIVDAETGAVIGRGAE